MSRLTISTTARLAAARAAQEMARTSPRTQPTASPGAAGAATAPAASPTATPATAPAAAPTPGATAANTVQPTGGSQDPQVVQNLAAEGNGVVSNRTTPTPARGLENPEPTAQVQGKVDLSQMTQDQQYDYLQKMVQEQGGADAWKSGDKELNLIGVRSFSGGKLNDGAANQYNDTIYACRMNNGKKEVYALDGSVDAGIWKDPSQRAISDGKEAQGIAHLADGHYANAFTRGEVSGGDQGLTQSGWLQAHIDKNNDGRISDDEKLGEKGAGALVGAQFRFQFHRGEGSTVGENSAGCQTIKAAQWGTFEQLLREAPDSQKNFGYTLVDGKNLKSAGEQLAYQPPAAGSADAPKPNSASVFNNMPNPLIDINVPYVGVNIHIDLRSQGRGMPSITGSFAVAGNDMTVVGLIGEDGIGIVRTPILGFTPVKW